MNGGSCLCGGVRFRIQAELPPIQVCHCAQCRRAQGTAFATNIPVEARNFCLDSGEELLREFESSPGKRRIFCGRCGSPVYSRRDAQPEWLRVRAGLLDDPIAARPGVHFHVTSACSWWTIDDALPKFPGALP